MTDIQSREKSITDEEIIQSYLADERELTSEDYPILYNISSAFFFQFQAMPKSPKLAEYVYVPEKYFCSDRTPEISVFISEWNISWESAKLRYRLFEDRIPEEFRWISKYKHDNIYLIPRIQPSNYYAYVPILHLLPLRLLKLYKLPILRKGNWPFSLRDWGVEKLLPKDCNERLSRAFALYIWPLINSGSKLNAFSSSDPIKLLAHNSDYWLPYINCVIENRLREFPRVEYESIEQKELIESIRSKAPDDISINRPLKGGHIWLGEDDAWTVAKEIIETADAKGNLRGIIHAIKSNRVEEDFSDRWSFEREDFERKLYNKRAKIKVKFVELTDTIPVQGPESEIHDNILWEDFLALLDTKEKQIVILLRNGYTKHGEISQILGYANHSPISKALKGIRRKLEKYIENSGDFA